jgi:hypothetical protein
MISLTSSFTSAPLFLKLINTSLRQSVGLQFSCGIALRLVLVSSLCVFYIGTAAAEDSLPNLPGCVMHFSASTNVVEDADNNVEEWESVAGGFMVRHARGVPGHPVLEATALNGKPGLKFSNGFQIGSQEIFLPAGNFTVFVVCSPNSDRGSNQTFLRNNPSDSEPSLTICAAGVGYRDVKMHIIAKPQAGPQVLVWNLNEPSGSVFRNGKLLGSSTYQPVGISSGHTTIGHHFDGLLGELIVFDRALSAAEQAQMETALMKKYGIVKPE